MKLEITKEECDLIEECLSAYWNGLDEEKEKYKKKVIIHTGGSIVIRKEYIDLQEPLAKKQTLIEMLHYKLLELIGDK